MTRAPSKVASPTARDNKFNIERGSAGCKIQVVRETGEGGPVVRQVSQIAIGDRDSMAGDRSIMCLEMDGFRVH